MTSEAENKFLMGAHGNMQTHKTGTLTPFMHCRNITRVARTLENMAWKRRLGTLASSAFRKERSRHSFLGTALKLQVDDGRCRAE